MGPSKICLLSHLNFYWRSVLLRSHFFLHVSKTKNQSKFQNIFLIGQKSNLDWFLSCCHGDPRKKETSLLWCWNLLFAYWIWNASVTCYIPLFGRTPLIGDRRGFMPPQLKTFLRRLVVSNVLTLSKSRKCWLTWNLRKEIVNILHTNYSKKHRMMAGFLYLMGYFMLFFKAKPHLFCFLHQNSN